MTDCIASLEAIAEVFDLAILDQYGVLHDGRHPYPNAQRALEWLERAGKEIVILSNSGKRSGINRQRIVRLGLRLPDGAEVISSGEAAWRALAEGRADLPGPGPHGLFALAEKPEDARLWAEGNPRIHLVDDMADADALLLMGMPPEADREWLDRALAGKLPLICTNPDRTSPRGAEFAVSPGVMADDFARAGGTVIWYGKPHREFFEIARNRHPEIPRERILMIGDSLLHDISGATGAGLRTVLVRSGIHGGNFADREGASEIAAAIRRLCEAGELPLPHYTLRSLA